MTPEEKRWMGQLCPLIEAEQDPDKFSVLVRELDELGALRLSEPQSLSNARERAVERSGAGRSTAEGRHAASVTKREMSNAKVERDQSYSFADSLYEFRSG